VYPKVDANQCTLPEALEEMNRDAAREHAAQARELAIYDGLPYTYTVALAEAG